MSDLKLAIFDVDGTLVDSRQVIHKAMDRAFVRAGLGEIDYDRVRTIVGLELGEAVSRLAPPDYPVARTAELAGYYKEAFVQMRAEDGFAEPLYDGARETVERLVDEGWLLGVATGKARRGLDIVFSHHGLHTHFQTLEPVVRFGPAAIHAHLPLPRELGHHAEWHMGKAPLEPAVEPDISFVTCDFEVLDAAHEPNNRLAIRRPANTASTLNTTVPLA